MTTFSRPEGSHINGVESTVYIIDSTHKLLIQVLLARPLKKQLGVFLSVINTVYTMYVFIVLF